MRGLAVLGSTSLVRDDRDLPTGSDIQSETILQPDAPLYAGQSLFLIANTTDGSRGDDVTIEGFVVEAIDGPFPERFHTFP